MGGLDHPGSPPPKSVYLAGAIEYAPDGGKQWRSDIEAFLQQELGLPVFNPCVNEWELLTLEEKVNFRRWKSENRELFLPVIRRIIDHDLDTVLLKCSFIVCLWDEHATRGTGTAGELTLAYRNRIPVYLVCEDPPASVSSWILGCATEIFPDLESLKSRLREMHAG